MKTGIYRFEKGMVIDITGNPGNPLIWDEQRNIWERSGFPPMKYDLTKAVELTAEDLVRAKILKITPCEEGEGGYA
jgi:hypothetical protein